MILKFLIELIITIVMSLLGFFSSLLNFQPIDISDLMGTIFTITSQSLNFTYFLFGNSIFFIVPTLFVQLFYAFVTLPLVEFARGFIKWR